MASAASFLFIFSLDFLPISVSRLSPESVKYAGGGRGLAHQGVCAPHAQLE